MKIIIISKAGELQSHMARTYHIIREGKGRETVWMRGEPFIFVSLAILVHFIWDDAEKY